MFELAAVNMNPKEDWLYLGTIAMPIDDLGEELHLESEEIYGDRHHYIFGYHLFGGIVSVMMASLDSIRLLHQQRAEFDGVIIDGISYEPAIAGLVKPGGRVFQVI